MSEQQIAFDRCLETALTLRARYGTCIEQRMLAFDALRALREKQREQERKKEVENPNKLSGLARLLGPRG